MVRIFLVFKNENKAVNWTATLWFNGNKKVLSGKALSEPQLSDPINAIGDAMKKSIPIEIITNRIFVSALIATNKHPYIQKNLWQIKVKVDKSL